MLAERYLRLGLQIGRHVDGIVDAYFGPPELAATVEADPPVELTELVAAADALLEELEDGWLRDQVAGPAEAQAYIEHWALMPAELAAHFVRFATEPTSRTYVLTYSAGRELCRDYVAGDRETFARLLTEQVRVGELLRGGLG